MSATIPALRRTALFLLAGFVFLPLQAAAWDRGKAELFATLPDAVRSPRASRPIRPAATSSSELSIAARRITSCCASTATAGVAQIPRLGPLAPRVVPNPDGSADSITFGHGARVPNALTFDRAGNLYVSDSFQGAIFRIDSPAIDGCGSPPTRPTSWWR